jgi:hypothetical protein
MKLDKAGNIYICGYLESSSTVRTFLTLKYSYSGELQWTRTYNCMNVNEAVGLVVDTFGNVYVTGRSDTIKSNLNTVSSLVLIKYSTDGNLLWMKRYVNEDSIYTLPRALCLDDSTNIYVTGDSFHDPQNSNYTTVKYDKNGNFIWDRFYDGANGYDVPLCITYKNNFIYITGSTNQTFLNTLKYNTNGERIWTSNFDSWGRIIIADDSIHLFIGGETLINNDGAFRTSKYDSSGTFLWSKTFQDTCWYNSYNTFRDIGIDKKGNSYVTGWSPKDAPYGTRYVTIKYKPNGDSLWTRVYHTIYGNYPSDDASESIVTDKAGNVYVTGSSDSNFVFYRFCTIKYDSNGVRKWIARYPLFTEFTSYYAKKIILDSAENIYIVGESIGNGTGNDIIILKYSTSTAIHNISTEIPVESRLFQNYPNPFNGITNIKYQITIAENGKTKSKNGFVILKVFDMLGREINTLINEKQNSGIYDLKFDAGNLSTGIYFYRLTVDGIVADTKKLVLIK